MNFSKLIKKLLFTLAVITSLAGFSAPAQTAAPAPAIGPATTGVSKTILAKALTPETRQTLQEAMDSYDPLPASGPMVMIGPGEGAELDGAKVSRVPYDSLPAPLKAALVTGVQGWPDNRGR
jgi:hypothetical protein